MKKFNKNKVLIKLNNRNNKNIKIISISMSIFILVSAIIYFSFARFEKVTTYSLIDGTIADVTQKIVKHIKELKTNGATDLEYDGVDTLGENGTEDNNLRYIGANPNNYIYFNCTTTNPSEMNDTSCEKWRIIGVMNNIEDENGNLDSRVKIMRDEIIGEYSWDSSDSSINGGTGINQWGESTYEDGTPYEGADLMRELNTDYLGNITIGTDGKWYTYKNNEKYGYAPNIPLNQNAQNMIQTVKWNIGANPEDDYSLWTTKNMYNAERSNNIGRNCSSENAVPSVSLYCDDTVVRTTTWVGKVALIYPSDYGYSTSGGSTTNRETCLNTSLTGWECELNGHFQCNNYSNGLNYCPINSWLFNEDSFKEWTLLPEGSTVSSMQLFFINYTWSDDDSPGYVYDYYSYGDMAVRPALYLKNNINVIDGNGSESSPYKLVLK